MKNKIKIALAGLIVIVGVEMGSGLITTVKAYSDGLYQQINIVMTME